MHTKVQAKVSRFPDSISGWRAKKGRPPSPGAHQHIRWLALCMLGIYACRRVRVRIISWIFLDFARENRYSLR